MSTPVITARGTEFRDIMAELNSGLRYAFNLSPSSDKRGDKTWSGDDDYVVIVVSGSGTAGMEMVIANRFRTNDRVLVPTNGKFGERVAEMCDRYCNLKHMKYEWGRAFDLYEMETELEKGIYEAVLICHNETSSGITQDAEAIAEMCQRHNVAFILDGITSIGGMPVHPEKWSAEALVVGAQKCTAGPSGIAAIAINQSFIERVKTIRGQDDNNALFYLDLIPALKKGDDEQTPWTPAINLAMGWSEALKVLKEEGLESRWHKAAKMADGVRNLFTDCGFELLADEQQRSDSVTAIMYPNGVNDNWRSRLKDVYQTQVIGGQDHLKGKMFRVGSMGETTLEEMIEGCKRMFQCFKDFDVDLPQVDIDAYFH